MRKFTIILLSLGLAWLGHAQVALGGLFTPVHLQPDSTVIFLRDYLVDEPVWEVHLPKGLTNHSQSPDTLLLVGQPAEKLSLLSLDLEQGRRDLLLIQSSHRPVELRIDAALLSQEPVVAFGEFNNWNREAQPLALANGYWRTVMHLPPGRYEYKLYQNGEEILDPSNPQKISNGMGSYNNLLEVASPPGRAPEDYALRYDQSVFYINETEESPNRYRAFWNNRALELHQDMEENWYFNLPAAAMLEKRSFVRVYSYAHGQMGPDKLIPLEDGAPLRRAEQLSREDWHQARLYFLMVDRFKNGNPQNDQPVPDPDIKPMANYMGGDLEGVLQVFQSGYFDSLGVNTVWLSPITQNPLDAWGYWDKGTVKSKFSGYHGYWPISNVKVDFRFGNESILRSLLAEAHEREFNMLLDYVANHVHIQHPIFQKNPEWATSLYLPDGTKNTEKWDSHRLTTWFDDHLPTLDLRRYDIVDPMVDSALIWLTRYNFDGFRHDATKHIDELYWRTLTYRIRQQTDRPIYQIGETYGSPQLINSYLSTGMLDGQFDFNLYDAAVRAFATGEGLADLDAKLHSSLNTYGHHHLMGNISGNQDRARFISYASGDVAFDEDAKLAGWEREIGQPSAEAYRRLALLHAFNFAIPGIPVIYYGDEWGMPGAGDPDNRRMMRFDLTDPEEKKLLSEVQQLNRVRGTELALIYGSTRTHVTGDMYYITRTYLGDTVMVVLNLSANEPATLSGGDYWQELAPKPNQTLENTIRIPPLGYLILKKRNQ